MVVFKNFFGTSRTTEIVTSVLDLVMMAAGLASNPQEISVLTSRARSISEQASLSGLLSTEDETALLHIYLEIEHYLTTRDPIRVYTREELRAKASRGLLARLEAYEKQEVKV